MIEPRPAHPFAWTPRSWGRALQSEVLNAAAHHFFTTRDLALRGPAAEHGWRRVAEDAGVDVSHLARLKQVHGTTVVVIRDGAAVPSHERPPHADIVITDDPRVAVVVQVADCVPLLLVDRTTGAVAAVHAGWRGTAAGAARHAVAAMQSTFGSRPAELMAAIGPSIGPCCYDVGAEVLEAFRTAGFGERDLSRWFRPDAGTKYRLNVAAANVDQLRAAGVEAGNIGSCGLCTACHPSLFPSYRRDGAGAGRIAAVIRARRA